MAQETIDALTGRLSPDAELSRGLAAARALESERENPLINDPYARRFAGETGFGGISEALSMLPKRASDLMLAAVSIRTRYFDDLFLTASLQGVKQFLSIGAGFDSRGFRLRFPENSVLWEIDRQEIFDLKEPILVDLEAKPNCRRRIIAADLRDDNWKSKLLETGFDPSLPAAFLLEGLLVYLEPQTAHLVLDDVTGLAAPGSLLGVDVMGKSLFEFGPFRRHREWLAAKGCPFLFTTEHPEELLASRGWIATSAVPGERAAHYGRWPFSAFPRSTPGIPRNYYLSATR